MMMGRSSSSAGAVQLWSTALLAALAVLLFGAVSADDDSGRCPTGYAFRDRLMGEELLGCEGSLGPGLCVFQPEAAYAECSRREDLPHLTDGAPSH